jgi:uncharacterized repeat protein (TIGR01451 family)
MLADILGSAASFAVLAGTTVTNTGSTTIGGNVGVSPGTAVTGFGPGIVSGGAIHAGDATATQAEANLATAYGQVAGEAVDTQLSGQNLGGLTLTPGVYHFNSAAQLTGTLTLDAQGNPDARFDIQIGTTLVTSYNSAVDIIHGGQADNVYFQVGSSATLGADTAFQGNILANTSITLDTGANILEGRALAINGAVTLDTNQVSVPQADVSVTNTTAAGPVVAGNAIAYTVTVANAGPSDAQSVALSDPVPADTTFISDAQTAGPPFTLSSPNVGDTGTITGTIGTLPSGQSASFSVAALVSPSTPSGTSIINTADEVDDTTDPNLANDSQTVTTTVTTEADVSVTNTAAPAPLVAGDTVAYTVTVTNSGPSDAQTVALNDPIPADETFVSDAQTSGPAFTLTNPVVGAAGTVTGSISTLAAGASASFTVVALVAPSTASGATITNTAVISTATTDPNIGNNSQSVTSTVTTEADVSVTNSTASGPVIAGDTIAYTITVTNAGPSDAQTVSMTDPVPADTSFVSNAQTSGPTFALTSPTVGGPGTINNTITTLAAGASASFTIVDLVSPSTANGATITNTADVDSALGDPNLINNSHIVTTSVSGVQNGPVVSAVSPGSGAPSGGTLVTITGSNFTGVTAVVFGSTPASNVTVVNSTTITADNPPGNGLVDVTVLTTHGRSTLSSSDQFGYISAPTITSLASGAFTAGLPGTFTISTTGFPLPTLTSSTLPAGLTFVSNLDGTATLSGTPIDAATGTYTVTFNASNGILPAATQTFTLTVKPAGSNVPTVIAGTRVPPIVVNPATAFGPSAAVDKKLKFVVANASGAGATVSTKTIRVRRGSAKLGNLKIRKAGVYNVTISDSLGNTTTEQVTIVAAAPRKLAFTAPVTTLAIGQTVSVGVFDKYGNSSAAADGTSVTLKLGRGSKLGHDAVLAGTLTATVAEGVAEFTDVSVGQAGKERLFAYDGKLKVAHSRVFTNA